MNIYQCCKIVLLTISFSLIASCSAVDINGYANNYPTLALTKFFNGKLSAHGIIKNRAGEVTRYFNVTMTGHWSDNGTGTLDEYFLFDDGEQQRRIWTFEPQSDGSYLASANDVSTPTKMYVSGNALFMDYILNIQYQGEPLDIAIEDKMYLIDENVMINESTMTKWGFEVGYITLTLIKES